MNPLLRLIQVMLILALGFQPHIAVAQAADEPEILTPPPAPEPRINGAKVFGVRPGHPVLYTIAATGRRPMKFSIALAVVEGRTNAEVAGQLFLSVKTVEFHLSSVYRKLGVRSRGGLAKALSERG